MHHMSANRQWKVVDERQSGNIFAHILCIVLVTTTQKLRKTAQYLRKIVRDAKF